MSLITNYAYKATSSMLSFSYTCLSTCLSKITKAAQAALSRTANPRVASPACQIGMHRLPEAQEAAALQKAIAASLAPDTSKRQSSTNVHNAAEAQEADELEQAIAASLAPDTSIRQVRNKVSSVELTKVYEPENPRELQYMADQIDEITATYPYLYPIRGDGNCFYTAFAVDFLTSYAALTKEEKTNKTRAIFECDAESLVKRSVISALARVANGSTPETMSELLSDNELMEDFVVCLRAVGIKYIQKHSEEFVFAEGLSLEDTLREMQNMGRFAEQTMILSVVKALQHPIRVREITGRMAADRRYDMPTENVFPESASPERMFILTPGHYSLVSGVLHNSFR